MINHQPEDWKQTIENYNWRIFFFNSSKTTNDKCYHFKTIQQLLLIYKLISWKFWPAIAIIFKIMLNYSHHVVLMIIVGSELTNKRNLCAF